MRKGRIIAAVILVVVLIAADRISLFVAESRSLTGCRSPRNWRPVRASPIKGFPFLPQVLVRPLSRGRCVGARHHAQGGLTVDKLTVRAHGVSVPLVKVMSGSVREVPVDHAEAVVTVELRELNAYIAGQLGEVLKVSEDNGNCG